MAMQAITITTTIINTIIIPIINTIYTMPLLTIIITINSLCRRQS